MFKHSQNLIALVLLNFWDIIAVPNFAVSLTRIPRIVGGSRCDIREHPYMVAVFKPSGFSYAFECGGSLVAQYWVLTASRCMDGNCGRKYVYAGVNIGSINSNLNKHAQRSRVKECFKFSHPTTTVSIGLLRLKKAIFEVHNVKFVKIATSRDPPLKEACKDAITMGWGEQHAQYINSTPIYYPLPNYNPYLQCLHTSVFASDAHCAQKLEIDKLVPDTFCTYAGLNKDTCKKDTGGPLICNGLQYGVFLWSRGCANGENPSTYATIYEDKHHTFFNDTMNNNAILEMNIVKLFILGFLLIALLN